jgi:hypothetical protein
MTDETNLLVNEMRFWLRELAASHPGVNDDLANHLSDLDDRALAYLKTRATKILIKNTKTGELEYSHISLRKDCLY